MWSKAYNKLFHESGSWKKLTVFPNVDITPELASDLLRLNEDNRPVKPSVLKQYIADMKNEKWHFTGDTIRISKSGRLLDGQHRLMAISQSGMPQKFNIQSGLENESFTVMDTGKLRNGGDALAIAGYKNYNVMAGAIRFIINYSSILQKVSKTLDNKNRISNDDVVQWTKAHDMELLEKCTSNSAIFYKRARFMSPSSFAALYFIFSRKDREMATVFFEMLASGENMSRTSYSAVFLLRERLINMLQSRLALKDPNNKYALVIKAWNFFRQGKEIKALTYNPEIETFPMAE